MLRRRRPDWERDLAARERLERPESDMTPGDRRSLEFGRATAVRLLAELEAVVELAWRNLARLREVHESGHSEPYFREWEELLSQGPEAAARMLSSTSQRACDMRSASPFAGILTEEERWAIIEATTKASQREGTTVPSESVLLRHEARRHAPAS